MKNQSFTLLFFTALFGLVSFLHSQESFGENWIDPVVMENSLIRLVIDRQRGATLVSLFDKKGQEESAREFRVSAGWCGALAEDRLAGDGYPGDITRLHYSGTVKRIGGKQVLLLHCKPDNKKYRGLEFFKTFILADDASFVTVDWRIVNNLAETQAVTAWVHNIVGRQYRNTLLPRKDGIALIPPSADYFHDPIRNWIAGYNPESQKLIYFCADFSQMLKQYYCYWNGYHTLEWTYQPAPLTSGQSWQSHYVIGINNHHIEPSSIIPEAVASYEWKDGQLQIDISWNCAMQNTTLIPEILAKENKVLLKQTVHAKAGEKTRLVIPGEQIPREAKKLRLRMTGTKSKTTAEFATAGNKLEFDIDPIQYLPPSKLPPSAWEAAKSPYLKVVPRVMPAKKISQSNKLQIWEVSPLEKIFATDSFFAQDNYPIDIRAIRNSRFSRQFVLHNTGEETLTVKIKEPFFHLSNASEQLKISLRKVGYVTTTEPSGFTLKFPVGAYPDPLLPMPETLQIPAGQSQPLWLEGVVDKAQKPGLYSGSLTMLGADGEVSLPLTCQVLDLTLPERNSMRSTVGCWSLKDTLLKEVGYSGSPAEFQKKCREIYLQHRLTPRENGLRWTFDENMELALQELSENNVTSIWIPDWVNRDATKLEKAVAALKRHGLFEMAFCYMMDEAPADRFPEVIESCKRLHSLHPDLKLLGTIYEKDVSALYGHIQIWCRNISSEPWQKERKAQGDEFMSSNLPGAVLENPGYAIVVPMLQMHYHGYSGFLFWNMIGGYGKDNPWKNILCAGANGNAHLLYPHASGPIETIRWKNMYYGIELFELLSMLQENKPEKYRTLQEKLENPDGIEKIRQTRERLLQYFEDI